MNFEYQANDMQIYHVCSDGQELHVTNKKGFSHKFDDEEEEAVKEIAVILMKEELQ